MGPEHEKPKDRSRFHEEMDRLPHYRPPAILFPHGTVGNSASGIAPDVSKGKFGPFEEQLFVADQTHSVVNRCFLEKVNGYYQGACFPFVKGFGSGNVPVAQAPDGSLFSGGTDRGWGARGGKRYALDRVIWTGETPFEILEMRIQKDGFELEFTKPVDKASAESLDSYEMKTHTYVFQGKYGARGSMPRTPRSKAPSLQRMEKLWACRRGCNGVSTNSSRRTSSKDETIPCFTIWLTTRFGTFRSPNFKQALSTSCIPASLIKPSNPPTLQTLVHVIFFPSRSLHCFRFKLTRKTASLPPSG